MYVPGQFAEADPEVLRALIRSHPLGAWVTPTDHDLLVNHLPFLLDSTRGERGVLVGHVARANQVWQQFSRTRPSVVIFQDRSSTSPVLVSLQGGAWQNGADLELRRGARPRNSADPRGPRLVIESCDAVECGNMSRAKPSRGGGRSSRRVHRRSSSGHCGRGKSRSNGGMANGRSVRIEPRRISRAWCPACGPGERRKPKRWPVWWRGRGGAES